MQEADCPEDVLKEIRENEPINDQWEAQILAEILEKANVVVVTEGVKRDVIMKMMMESAPSLEEALDLARRKVSTKKPRIVAMPEGPYIIPRI